MNSAEHNSTRSDRELLPVAQDDPMDQALLRIFGMDDMIGYMRHILITLLPLVLCDTALAVTVSPGNASLTVGASQTVGVSNATGAISVKNTNATSIRVTRLTPTSYQISGLAAGSGEVEFKDRASSTKLYVSVAPKLAGRLLASNCFQCHDTNGSGGFERLTGSSANKIYRELKEFANGNEDSDGIMAAHAMGFTDEQLRAIADYFASQR